MKKILFLAFLIISTAVQAAPPTRAYTYVSNTTIDPNQNNTNENALYSYLQVGVDTYAPGSITGAAVSSSASIPYASLSLANSIVNSDISTTAAISPSKISAGGGVLPSGAVYFMITGSCPTGTTDVSGTYSNLFIRINSTAGSTGGSDTHTHTAGTFAVSGNTGDVVQQGISTATDGVNIGDQHRNQIAPFSASVTGTSASGNNVPAYVTMKACQVN